MHLTFLGTSAANAFPEPFCLCSNCEQARQYGGKSFRKRSAALINDDLLLDFGPDILTASALHGCVLTNVRYCLQTHAHADHLDPSHFLSRSPGFGVIGAPQLHFYASPGTLRRASHTFERDLAPYSFFAPDTPAILNVAFHQIEAMQSFTVGPYRVTAVPANHDPAVEPLLYVVEADGCTVFYGTDTAALSADVWNAFHRQKLRFDLVILDHTYGPDESEHDDHLNSRQFIEHVQRMRGEKLFNNHARAFATHIAHEGNPAHPELCGFAAQHGYEIAYDGLIITIPKP